MILLRRVFRVGSGLWTILDPVLTKKKRLNPELSNLEDPFQSILNRICNSIAGGYLFPQGITIMVLIYQMVTQNSLRICDRQHVSSYDFSFNNKIVTAVDLKECLK